MLPLFRQVLVDVLRVVCGCKPTKIANCFWTVASNWGTDFLTRVLVRVCIAECQQEIAHLTTNPFYTSPQPGEKTVFPPYRKYECFYWGKIPSWIIRYSMRQPIRNCLDVGCGYGTLALFTHKINPDCHVYLIDFTDRYLSPRLLKKYGYAFTRLNIELEPIPYPIKFDVIIFTEILEHLNFNPLPTLQKLHQGLDENGVLFLSTPNAETWGRLEFYTHWTRMPMPTRTQGIVDGHVYQYTLTELRELLDQAGFVIEALDYSGIANYNNFNAVCRKKGA
jgi:SAM-dependent methyltransferase